MEKCAINADWIGYGIFVLWTVYILAMGLGIGYWRGARR